MCDPILDILFKTQPQSIQPRRCDHIQRHIPLAHSLRLKGSTADPSLTINYEKKGGLDWD